MQHFIYIFSIIGNIGDKIGCTTVSGKSPNASCIFPFKTGGTTYHKCKASKKYASKYWCSTLVDDSGKHIKGNLGYCEKDCNLKIGKKYFI